MSPARLPETESTPAGPDGELRPPSFAKAFRFWLLLGFISFGGPAGQIAIMQRELVERRRWIDQERFLHALNFCVLLPGPEAQQLAIYLGWLLHRTRGGVAAGVLFVLPSAFLLWLLSWLYLVLGGTPWIAAAVYGLKPAVIAIVFVAVLRLGRKALRDGFGWSVAGLAFIGLLIFRVPYPLIIFSAALAGFIRGRLRPTEVIEDPGARSGVEEIAISLPVRPTLQRTAGVAATCLLIWWLPVALLGWCLGKKTPPFAKACSSAKLRWSPSAALTRSCPMSRGRPWSSTTGLPPGRCSMAWVWRRPRLARSSWCCSLLALSVAGITPAPFHRCGRRLWARR